MRRRRWLVALAIGLAILAVGSAVDFHPSPPPGPVTLTNFNRIHSAMSRQEVAGLLGRAADYRINPTIPPVPRQMHEHFVPPGAAVWSDQVDRVDEWYTDSAEVLVVWGHSGTIIKAVYVEMDPPNHSPLGRLLRVAKLLWREWFP
jgi:hypothetical protein